MNNKISLREKLLMETPIMSYDELESNQLSSMGSLKDDEREFLMMKRMKVKYRFSAPDPRLGDYEA